MRSCIAQPAMLDLGQTTDEPGSGFPWIARWERARRSHSGNTRGARARAGRIQAGKRVPDATPRPSRVDLGSPAPPHRRRRGLNFGAFPPLRSALRRTRRSSRSERRRVRETLSCLLVMAALVAAIHVFFFGRKAWMPGTSPGMTTESHSDDYASALCRFDA